LSASTANLTLLHRPAAAQGKGAFDGGRITETKPVGFPHEGRAIPHLGPLFYWAWATGHGKIGLHPHKGFEIMSYVLHGEIGHFDTLGNTSRVAAGGAQIMQAGSGLAHAEETLVDPSGFFQIWFEPDLAKTLHEPPCYHEIEPGRFPRQDSGETKVKTLLGPGAPVQLKADAAMQDATVRAGRTHSRPLGQGRTLAAVVVSGCGNLLAGEAEQPLSERDLMVIHAHQGAARPGFQAGRKEDLRLLLIEVPARVGYPLYRDGL